MNRKKNFSKIFVRSKIYSYFCTDKNSTPLETPRFSFLVAGPSDITNI